MDSNHIADTLQCIAAVIGVVLLGLTLRGCMNETKCINSSQPIECLEALKITSVQISKGIQQGGSN